MAKSRKRVKAGKKARATLKRKNPKAAERARKRWFASKRKK